MGVRGKIAVSSDRSDQNSLAIAPGKLVICGEYAVIGGGMGLSVAVDRFAKVEASFHSESSFKQSLDDWLSTDFLGSFIPVGGSVGHNVSDNVDGASEYKSINRAHPPKGFKKLVSMITQMETISGRRLASIRIDTSQFYDASKNKLGLGSSAAIASALVSLFFPDESKQKRLVRVMPEAGSGIDIASSLFGGMIAYQRLAHKHPVVQPVKIPTDLKWAAVFGGKSAKTHSKLRALQVFQTKDPSSYQAWMDEIKSLSKVAVDAIVSHKPTSEWLSAVDDFYQALLKIEKLAEISILTADHHKIRQIASQQGVLYKTSGAGGGDCGILLSTDHDALCRALEAIRAEGFKTFCFKTPLQGIRISQVD